MVQNELKIEEIENINLDVYRREMLIWKRYWHIFYVTLFVVSLSFAISFGTEEGTTFGGVLGVFIFCLVAFGLLLGFMFASFYSGYENKMKTREECWSMLSLAQQCVKLEYYSEGVIREIHGNLDVDYEVY